MKSCVMAPRVKLHRAKGWVGEQVGLAYMGGATLAQPADVHLVRKRQGSSAAAANPTQRPPSQLTC